MVFTGSRDAIWHRVGTAVQPGWSIDDWRRESGNNWEAVKVPALADMSTLGNGFGSQGWKPMGGDGWAQRVNERYFIVRNDNGNVLSPNAVSERYELVQPADLFRWFEQYVGVDPRFKLDVAGTMWGGAMIWATAVYDDGNGSGTVAGERHTRRLLMTTTFDGTGSTINRACVTRAICQNTIEAALGEREGGMVRTRHSTKFNADAVGKELAKLAQSFDRFKALGDAMAAQHLTDKELSNFFKLTLDIDPKATRDEMSKRASNKFDELVGAYHVGTRREGLEPRTGWAALQAVTRWADHNRSVRNGGNTSQIVTRFGSSVIDGSGGGAMLKEKAIFLLNEMSDGELLKAVAAKTPSRQERKDNDDMAALLAQPFRPSKG